MRGVTSSNQGGTMRRMLGIAATVASVTVTAGCGGSATKTVTVHAPLAKPNTSMTSTASGALPAPVPARPLDVTAICSQMRQSGTSLNSGTVTIGRAQKVTGCQPTVDDSTRFSTSSPNPTSLYMLAGWRAWKVWVADDETNTGVVTCTFTPDVGNEIALHAAAGSEAATMVDRSKAHNDVAIECSSNGGGDAIALGGQILSSGS